MNGPAEVSYRHTQRSWLHWLLDGIGALMMVLALVSGEPYGARLLMVGLGTLFLVVGSSFGHLTVEDRGDRLAIRFGPLPLFRTSVRYDDMRQVEVGRTLLTDGWGIHLSLRGGWVWNIGGRDCVVIRHRGGTLRVGSDDAEGLYRFLERRVGDGGGR